MDKVMPRGTRHNDLSNPRLFDLLIKEANHQSTTQSFEWTITQRSPADQWQRSFKKLSCLDPNKGIYFVKKGTQVEEQSGKIWTTASDGFMIFPPDLFYNLFIYKEAQGIFFYLNLSEPLIVEKQRLHAYYKDLYIDIRLSPDGRVEIFDQDELLLAQNSGLITPLIAEACRNNLTSLYESALTRSSPFNLEELKTILD